MNRRNFATGLIASAIFIPCLTAKANTLPPEEEPDIYNKPLVKCACGNKATVLVRRKYWWQTKCEECLETGEKRIACFFG